jgi:type IV pilus assembly protein PilY1
MKHNSIKIKPQRSSSAPLFSMTVAFFCTLLAMPAISGVTISDIPLQSSRPAPPNILFILDDSGSMGSTFIAPPDVGDDVAPTTNAPDIGQQTYARNSIYYNPAVNYTRWKDSTGADLPDVTYDAAYSSATLATVASGTINLNNATQNFYVPKSPTNTALTYLMEPNNYWLYQIRSTAAGGTIVRADTPLVTDSNLGTTGNIGNNNYSATYTIVVPANTSNLFINSNGGTGNSASMYVRFNAVPDTGNFNCRSRNNGTNTERCVIQNPAAGTWQIRMYGDGGGFNGVVVTSRYAVWQNHTAATPTGRSDANEKLNFARWYSYHRTRNKVAKNGAGLAFQGVGGDKRVGFTTIHGDAADTLNIPVGTDDGLFRDLTTPTVTTNRSSWFNKLYSIGAGGFTPLRSALRRAGEYYSDPDATGPYGPGTGADQLACRKNFTILTTDGYWNPNDDIAGYAQADGDDAAGSTITGPPSASYTYAVGRPYNSVIQNDTLADEAMKWWKTDLRTETTMPNIVPVSTNNPAFWQHMVTFGISIGLKGTLDPTPATLASITSGATNWTDPINNDGAERIDDLWHATVNSRGTFVAATKPDEFQSGLSAALNDISAREASNSNASANSTSLSDGALLFQAKYTSATWDGDLDAYTITGGALSATPTWSAAGLIPTYASGLRKIFTWNGTAGANFPTTAQETALTTPIANYIRGDRSNETSTGYRSRPSLLGDIVNSSPTYVKQTDTIYVGANDGMLHAFSSVTGVELFSYVPSSINFANLKTLSDKNYSHKYFVDGNIVVSSRAQTTGVTNFVSPNNNKNILVGALGRGGKGVFALDVTNPSAMASTNVKWESAADSGMGNVLGRSFIAKLNTGASAVIVANGPNSTDDTAQLFIFDLNTGAQIAKINTGSGPNNGLSSPIGWDNDNDGDVDFVYSGDLLGNMWKFDISSGTASNWTNASNRQILYTAYDAGSPAKRQPITGRPTIARDPTTYKRWVFFGTGQLLTISDPASKDVQTWYGIIDDGSTISGRTALQQRAITVAGVVSGKDVRGFEVNSALTSGKLGWYVDLKKPPSPGTAEGERMVGDQRLFDNILIAASIIPSTNSCLPGGSGFVNAIDAFTGSSISSPGFFDIDGDGDFTDDTVGTGASNVPVGSVDLGVGMGTNPLIGREDLIQCGSGANCGGSKHFVSNRIGRISWREVLGN